MLYFHGGGWCASGTGGHWNVLTRISNDLKIPVFSLEYRHAPKYKFPIQSSDCLQGYLWLRYYAEKYLKLKFKKIILYGNSAGGHLSHTVPLLCNLKNIKNADGVVSFGPVGNVDVTKFYPSSLAGLDCTNLTFAKMISGSSAFAGTVGPNDNYILNPICAPEDAFKVDGKLNFPRFKLIMTCQEVLRDSVIDFVLKWLKHGVDIKAVLYR